MELLCHLLPNATFLQLENWLVDKIKTQITLIVSSVQAVVKCPVCNQPTHRIHSHYGRNLADLPWADYSITLQLSVRKFFCLNTECKRRIFTERLGDVAVPWARKTLRLTEKPTAIGLALGGEAGEDLSQCLVPVVVKPSKRSLTPSRATWLVLRRPELREPDDEKLLTLLVAQHPSLAEAIKLAQDFASMVRQRQPSQLDPWLKQTIDSHLSPFRRFALRLREDYNRLVRKFATPSGPGFGQR